MKHYAKKRTIVRAVQWLGEMTPDVLDLVGDRAVSVGTQQQVELGNGWSARVSDWIFSTSGEDLAVISDDTFRNIYEEVDATGRTTPPTDAEHEAAGLAFVLTLEELLVTGMRLAPNSVPTVFRDRDALVRQLRHLLEDHAYLAAHRERKRIREMIAKDLTP